MSMNLDFFIILIVALSISILTKLKSFVNGPDDGLHDRK